jgi:hypothetical protein
VANTHTTTSRKPRTAVRAASRPSPRPVAEPDVDDLEGDEPGVSEAEAQEIEAEGHYVTAALCGEDVRVIPPSAWRLSWQRLLSAGEIDAFADKVLHPDDVELLDEIDPTAEEFGQFIADAGQRAGESLGKSSGRSRSGRRTPRR